MDFLPAIVYYLNIMDNLFCAIRTLSQFITPAVALWDGLIPRRYAAAQPRLHLTVMPWALHYCLGVRCKEHPLCLQRTLCMEIGMDALHVSVSIQWEKVE